MELNKLFRNALELVSGTLDSSGHGPAVQLHGYNEKHGSKADER